MMSDLRISLVQADLLWEDIQGNLTAFDVKLSALAGKTDLVILPEMFTTGFSMQPSFLAESMAEQSVQWLKTKAQELQAVITGSLIITENGNYYNRLIWMQPNGEYFTYDKRHLFTLAKEQDYYTGGQERLIVEYKGWKICPLICYDLRFPVWSRNDVDYDLLIYVANFPERRNLAWKGLLQARAIENQAYTIGVNRVGNDGNDIYYSGDSMLIDYLGNIIYQISHQEDVFTNTLSYQKQQQLRSKQQFLADQDGFKIL